MNRLLKNRNGGALVLVIIFSLVLIILGTSILSLSVADARHAARQQSKINANYYARSGVDEVAAYIIKNETVPDLNSDRKMELDAAGDRYYEIIDIQALTGEDGYLITSKGSHFGVESNVSLKVLKDKASDILDVAVYANQNLDISLMKVNGDIKSGGTIAYSENGSKKYDTNLYTPYPNSPMDAEYAELPITLPTGLTNKGDLTANGNTINSSGVYGSIEVLNGKALTIDTSAYDIQLVVGSLDIKQGELTVLGENKLKLYVDDLTIESNSDFIISGDATRVEIYILNSANLWTPIDVNNDPNKLTVFIDAGKEFHIQAGGSFYGYIIGPEANIVLQASNVDLYGAVIGDLVTGNNGGKPAGSVTYILPDDSNDYDFLKYRKRLYR